MYMLHHVPDTVALIVRLALAQMSQPYRLELVAKGANGNASRAHPRLNPTGPIPVLETPQGPISEIAAIPLRLCEARGKMPPAPTDNAALLRLSERLEAHPATQKTAADEALCNRPFTAPSRLSV